MLRKLTILAIAITSCIAVQAQYHPLEDQRLSTTDNPIFNSTTLTSGLFLNNYNPDVIKIRTILSGIYGRINTIETNGTNAVVLSLNGRITTGTNALTLDNTSMPSWMTLMSANHDIFAIRRAPAGSSSADAYQTLFQLNNNGDVSIGPDGSSSLAVSGNITTEGSMYVNQNIQIENNITANGLLYVDDEIKTYGNITSIDGNLYGRNIILSDGFQLADGNEGLGRVLTSNAYGFGTWQTLSGSTTINSTNGYIPYRTSSTTFGNSPILTDGSKIGFGTTIDPNYNYAFNGNVIGNSYTVYGGANLSNTGIYTLENMQLRTWDGTNTQTRMFINAINGNVGIGTNYPSFKLDIGNGTGLQGVRINTGNGNNEGGYLVFAKNNENRFFIGDESAAYGGSGNDAAAYVYGNNKFHISTNTYKRLTVDGDGNVGIGTTIPIKKLDVIGEIISRNATNNSGIYIAATNGAWGTIQAVDYDNLTTKPLALQEYGGNVGIGTTSPDAQLEVSNNASNATLRLSGYGNAAASFGRLEFANTVPYSSTPRAYIESYRNSDTDNGFLDFATANTLGAAPTVRMTINPDGGIGIGTTSIPATYKLAVNGNIIAEKVVIKLKANWPDYVFDESYRLQPLNELEKFIQKNKHLPEIPSAAEVEKNGADVGANQALLLKKIEELTLYIIDQNKKIEALETKVNNLSKKQ